MKTYFTLNGEEVELEAAPEELLVDLLRLRLNMRGARPGCLRGQCGACSVLMNGELTASCLIPIFRVYGAEILTIEGLMELPDYQDIEKGFIRANARPCRFCAAGKFLSVHALLQSKEELTEQLLEDTISSVWCRCTTHQRLMRGIRFAADFRQRRVQRGG